MKVEVTTIELHGSCNFCNRGTLTEGKKGLQYPYDEVISIEGKKVSITICRECFIQLQGIKV